MAIPAPQIYDEILAFKASPKADERAAFLIDRNNAGTLTLEQEIELQQMRYFDGRMSVLKARAAARTAGHHG